MTAGSFGIRLTGVGGTGVVTVSQVLATAGLIAGWHARSLDQTGLAQKGGAVVSDVRFSRAGQPPTNKLGAGECDLYLGCDLLVAADPKNLTVTGPDRTVAVISVAEVPTGPMVSDPARSFPDRAAVSAPEQDKTPGSTALTEAVARYLYKLMAYKDEYEVARLSLEPALRTGLEAGSGPGARASWRLHPPVLRALGMRRTIALGPWFVPAFRVLRAMRGVRGATGR